MHSKIWKKWAQDRIRTSDPLSCNQTLYRWATRAYIHILTCNVKLYNTYSFHIIISILLLHSSINKQYTVCQNKNKEKQTHIPYKSNEMIRLLCIVYYFPSQIISQRKYADQMRYIALLFSTYIYIYIRYSSINIAIKMQLFIWIHMLILMCL